jgi:hypothetical protein
MSIRASIAAATEGVAVARAGPFLRPHPTYPDPGPAPTPPPPLDRHRESAPTPIHQLLSQQESGVESRATELDHHACKETRTDTTYGRPCAGKATQRR